ncbi:TRAP transporter small permease [Fictibacillus phosphorivorans]|uniref:TRAP transporter small permease n=1 Tax=Fictibacillus phosphorivorans TaxID=1221500 RepID=UPI00203FC44C|nr:TRAP transporter small permease [Fictibacillus phosphorivorans]MCM3720013.1 TRAP transporter small permease [Fictibacillus phosphorivorans]MCM3777717.1 TRAP transporter small permease [Fictibacillus phosphorivorans]
MDIDYEKNMNQPVKPPIKGGSDIFLSLSNGISRFEKLLALIFMLALAIIVALSVAFRYFFNAPLSWSGEVAVFLLIWISFIGGSLGLKNKSQAAVTLLLDYCPQRLKMWIGVFSQIFIIAFLVLLLKYTYTWILSDGVAFQKSTALLLPMWIPYSAVPIGLTFACIHILAQLVHILKTKGAEL